MFKSKIKRPAFSVRFKIIVVIYMILFPVLIATSGFIIINNYNTTVNESVRQYNSVLQTVYNNIRFMESDISDISMSFSVNNDFNNVLVGDSAVVAEDPLFWSKMAPTDKVRELVAIKSHIQTLILYPENGLPPFFTSSDASVHDTNIENIRNLPMYQTALEARGDVVRSRVNAGQSGLYIVNRTNKIVFSRTLFDLAKQNRLGFLAVSVNVSWYERICRNALLHDNEAMLIMNYDGIEIARAGSIDDDLLEFIKTGEYRGDSRTRLLGYNGWYIFPSDPSTADLSIYYLSPQANWSGWVRSGLLLPIMLAFALLICVWPLSLVASKIISRPLDRLSTSMNKFKAGDFRQQVEVEGSDEIAELSKAFNSMVRDLSDLIDKNYIMALRERESELDALQAQINPHFLYNALDSLYWQAVESDQEKLSEDILSMAELFRLLLSSGESDISIEKELKIITYYLQIQKMRFSKKFDYKVDVDERLYELLIPKLILQPFVENAVVHGLEQKDTWGIVEVKGTIENDMMVFTIEDNGTGMSRETLDEVLSTEKRYASQRVARYAIRNVRERVMLRYDSNCMLEIDSEVGVGSKVKISLPLEMPDRRGKDRKPDSAWRETNASSQIIDSRGRR